MSETQAQAARPTLFADAVTDVIVAHGVARMTLAVAGQDGRPMPVATLCIPVMQLPGFATGLNTLIQQMQQKAREAQQAQSDAEPDAGARDAAFRFQG